MVVEQLEGTVASEVRPVSDARRGSLSRVGAFLFTKLVTLMLFIVPKYVVGATTATCPWRTLGRL